MIPSWAKPGAKVVCVDAQSPLANNTGLSEGAIYTIAQVLPPSLVHGPDGRPCVEAGISLVEVRKPGGARGYSARRFRPLASRTQEQDVDLFKSLLNPTLVDKLDLLAERLDHIYNE